MTKESRTAKPVRATGSEWAEIDAAASARGQSRQEFLLAAALGVARGELRRRPAARTGGAVLNQATTLRRATVRPIPRTGGR